MKEPIRVLQVLGTTGLGGAESRVMDLYRSIDRERVQFDFAVHTSKKGYFDEEIEALGGHIYRLPRFQVYNWIPYRAAWRSFLKEHPEYTLRAIAEASGINSMPTFHNLFKSKTGMTPSEFKKVQMEME